MEDHELEAMTTQEREDVTMTGESDLPVTGTGGSPSEVVFRGDGKLPNLTLSILSREKARQPLQFREWVREVELLKSTYRLAEGQLAVFVYRSLASGKGQPREIVQFMEVADILSEQGYTKMMSLLKTRYGEKKHEEAARTQKDYATCRRETGQPMDDFLIDLYSAKMNAERMDPKTVYSDTFHANRLLRGANIPEECKRTILLSCDNEYNPTKIESALRSLYHDYHKT